VGTFRVRIEVGDAPRERFVPIDALVDTGATYTVLPTSLLEELEIVPTRSGLEAPRASTGADDANRRLTPRRPCGDGTPVVARLDRAGLLERESPVDAA
jgi:hypothetical protein